MQDSPAVRPAGHREDVQVPPAQRIDAECSKFSTIERRSGLKEES